MDSEQKFESVYSSANAGVYQTFFRHVRHENTLGNTRFGLMAQIQSLLLIAYAATLNGLAILATGNSASGKAHWVGLGISALQITLSVVGIISAILARQSIVAAYKAFKGYQDKFLAMHGIRPDLAQWPALGGAADPVLQESGWSYLKNAPVWLIGMWILILAGSIFLNLIINN